VGYRGQLGPPDYGAAGPVIAVLVLSLPTYHLPSQ